MVNKRRENLHETLHNKMFAENKVWLLLISFLAPLACIGTHGGFIVMAWASDPAQASSLAVVFTLSFFYYFFGFRQLYIRISCLSCFKHKSNNAECENRLIFEPIRGIPEELEERHKNLREINLSALVCELFFIPIFMSIQGIVVFSYYYLPGPISIVPLNVMNLLQLVLFFGTSLITYKLFTFSAPIEKIILHKFAKAYKPQASSTKDAAEVVGDALGTAMRRLEGPSNTFNMSPLV